jgi:imidazoleglycerol-phosphate dehydratase
MQNNLGIKIKKVSEIYVCLIRTTLESKIELSIEETIKRDYKIQTGIKFFNHMLTGLASRACLNLDVSYTKTNSETLDHVIVEDTGLTLGRAIREMLDMRLEKGVNQRGTYTVAFDEALVSVTLAFDGRAYCFLKGDIEGINMPFAEDILTTNIKQFFEGFAQGAGCAVFVQFLNGVDSHHTWEATFKAFGEALRESLLPCPYRKGTTIGLKGTGMEGKL